MIALFFFLTGMRRSPGDVFGLPENFFCAFPPGRRKIHSYYVFTIIENTRDLAFFSADSVEDNLANRERPDWHLPVGAKAGLLVVRRIKKQGSDMLFDAYLHSKMLLIGDLAELAKRNGSHFFSDARPIGYLIWTGLA
jgi:hypothetical protein